MADLSKATPGPWRYDSDINAIVSYVITDGREEDVICTFDWAEVPDDECDANAALIVKSVNERDELIAALRDCIAALEEHGVHLPANTHWEDDYRAWWTSQNSPDGRGIPDQGCSECAAIVRARAALAKAEVNDS